MCNCIKEIDKSLKELDNNTMLDIPITLSGIDRVRIGTTKRDDKVRKKPITIFPAYCPFCGEAYPEKAQRTEDE